MSAVPIQETAQQAVNRLFADELRQGYRIAAAHRYNAPDGCELFRAVRLKHPGRDKVMRPIYRDGMRYRLGRGTRPDAGWPLYVPPFPLVECGPVYVVEGEACADALARLGIAATTSGSSSSADTADWSSLRGRSVRLWPDNDAAGAKYADDVAHRLRANGCVVERLDVSGLGLPDKGDCVDWLALHPNATVDDVRALPITKVVESRNGIAPEPLPDPLPAVPTLDPALLPESVREWCRDTAEGLNVPLDFTGIPAMVALAGAIGRGVAVAMKEHGRWYERPTLWGCVIGRPSSGKSPALSPARGMLERLAGDERKAHEAEMQRFEVAAMVAEAKKANAKEAIRKAVKGGDAMNAEALAEGALFTDEPPAEPRIVVNDATVEKLGELLNANPRGLVQFRDELAGWLASLDREGRESDRAFWLECWNGTGAFTVDRIGRGTIRIEACAVSILGGMQPGKLGEYVRGAMRGGFSDDGLMQRFQLSVYPDLSATWRYCDRAPHPQAEARAWATFQRLRALDPVEIGAETGSGCDVPFLRMDAEAMGLLVEWQTALMQRLRAGDEPAWMESHLAKYPALVGRLALVLHLADGGRGPIPADVLARALDWCDFLEGHARRIYAPAIDGGVSAAHAILRKRGELPDGFTARDVYRKGWAGLSDPEMVTDGLAVLCEYRHLSELRSDGAGRPTLAYQWWAA